MSGNPDRKSFGPSVHKRRRTYQNRDGHGTDRGRFHPSRNAARNTASGKLERGEGILSLERAFQYAGCKSLLSTLWSIDDESSFLINQYFLENLNNGLEKDIALQNAKLKFILNTTPDKLHPFFWSSFRLSGNTDTLLKTANSIYYFFGVGTFVIVIILYLKRKKHKKVA